MKSDLILFPDPANLQTDTLRAVDQVARDSYGRLVAFLAARSRDIASAEDALSDAFHAALEAWPRTGVPTKPEAWLLTTARRRLIDRARHQQVQLNAIPTLLAATEQAVTQAEGDMIFPDERLRLMFICAHPAIDSAARTPLMLQTILGLDAARIAASFLVEPSTMGQRLTRAKTKIRDARISFELPRPDDLHDRLDAVLQAIYAAYGSGWDHPSEQSSRSEGLAVEALQLGRLLLQLMPEEPEVLGLVALMLSCEARRAARRSPDGEYIPLAEQDVFRWSKPLREEADKLLRRAERAGVLGRFQLEAAIQHVHLQRAESGKTDWPTIAWLYEGLVRCAPTVGALVGRAASFGEAYGAAEGWRVLEEIPEENVKSYQPYWALAAHLLKRLQRVEPATDAYRRAIALCDDQATREFLVRQSQRP